MSRPRKRPRLLAAKRPWQREALAQFPLVIQVSAAPHVYQALEDYEPGSTNIRVRRLDKFKVVARPAGAGWLAIFCRSDAEAVFMMMAVSDELAQMMPNPNILPNRSN